MNGKVEAIQAAIKGMNGAEQWLGRREIAELPTILWEDELPERIIQGYYVKGNGILVATNKRLIFIDKGLLFGLRVEDFAYDKISSIEYNTGLMFGELTIYTSGNRAKIEQVLKAQVREFAEYVRARKSGAVPPTITQAQAAPAAFAPGVTEQLEYLAKMRDKGILDEEEFKRAKAKVLGL